MKILSFQMILCFLLITASCRKTEYDPVPDIKASKDGTRWESINSSATLSLTYKRISIYGRNKYTVSKKRESLILCFPLSSLSGSNPVSNFSSVWYLASDAGGVSDKYIIDAKSENNLQITSFDTINKVISGTFRITLIRDKYFSEKGEIMNFTDGEFILKYQEVHDYNALKYNFQIYQTR